jgi:glutamate synthase domain-containing protein 2
MLPEEQENNSRYFYELASGKFGFSWDKVKKSQAFHFKGGQGAKTGTGGHLPGNKVNKEIAEVRGLQEGQTAISPAAFPDLFTAEDFRKVAEEVREKTGGIPVGFKIAASHIEADIDFALEVGVDYIILDGRGGGTGSAPTILRDNINVPTIPALARARRHLDKVGAEDVTLVITGRAARGRGLCQSHDARRRCNCCIELGAPGHRLPGNARLPYQQLPGGHCNAKE